MDGVWTLNQPVLGDVNHTPPDCLQRCYNHDRKVVPESSGEKFFPNRCCQIQCFTSSAKPPLHISHNLHHLHQLFFITYITYISFIHITCIIYVSFISATSLLHHLHHPHLHLHHIYNFLHHLYQLGLHQLHLHHLHQLHRSCYAGIAIQELWHTSCHTEFLTQVLAQDSKSRWSACIWNLPSSYFSSSSKLSPLAAGAARRQLTKRDPLRNMWWNANFVGMAVPFCTKWGRESPTGVNF